MTAFEQPTKPKKEREQNVWTSKFPFERKALPIRADDSIVQNSKECC